MDIKEFRSRIDNCDLTRRQATGALAAAGVGMMTMTFGPGGARAQDSLPIDDSLYVFDWGGYEYPEFYVPYAEKYGATPAYSLFGEEEEALQKLRSGFRADVAHPCTYSTRRWRDAGVIRPIDTSRLSNYADVFPSLTDLPGSIGEDGNTYFIPADWGNSSVLFRPDLAPEYVDTADQKNESWAILFDEKYAGRLGIFDSVDGVMAVVGSVIGAENVFDMTDEELAEAEVLLRKQREILRFYWTDQSSVEQALASGELVASYAWNSAVVELKNQGVDVVYMNPKEGIWTWVCGLTLLVDGPGDEDRAYEFIDAWMSPASGKNLIEMYGYGHSNEKSFELVDPATLADLGISDPATMMASSRFFGEIEPDVREKYINMFDEIKAGF
ncbi:MAG: extracellular solute-binding protein [Pseudomonadota bacterium]